MTLISTYHRSRRFYPVMFLFMYSRFSRPVEKADQYNRWWGGAVDNPFTERNSRRRCFGEAGARPTKLSRGRNPFTRVLNLTRRRRLWHSDYWWAFVERDIYTPTPITLYRINLTVTQTHKHARALVRDGSFRSLQVVPTTFFDVFCFPPAKQFSLRQRRRRTHTLCWSSELP